MARASTSVPVIRFRGIPASLAAVVADPVAAADNMILTFKPKGSRAPIEVVVQTDLDPRILRVTLPQELPPGVYEGTLQRDEVKGPVQLEVDAAPLLHVVPEQLRIEAHNGDLVGADVTMLNQGNVPVDLRSLQVVGIFMNGGIERALRRAYVYQLRKNQRRVDILADSLADAHGGLLRIKLEKGEGAIQPGEARELQLVIHVPTGLDPGAMYGGNWELPGLVYPISVHIGGDPGPEEWEDVDGGAEDRPRKTANRRSIR